MSDQEQLVYDISPLKVGDVVVLVWFPENPLLASQDRDKHLATARVEGCSTGPDAEYAKRFVRVRANGMVGSWPRRFCVPVSVAVALGWA